MLPLFPHEESKRAVAIFDTLNADGGVSWRSSSLYQNAPDPFRTLVSAMLSPRTDRESNRIAVDNLFALAQTPSEMAQLDYDTILSAIASVTYAENKARYLPVLSAQVAEWGEVPKDRDRLMELPGVGWKVALLTLWVAYGLSPEICVDVHVARIGKRLGLVNPATSQPQKVSQELMQIVPKNIWGPWNPTMVYHGRTICYPGTPNCAICPIYDLCERVGVKAR